MKFSTKDIVLMFILIVATWLAMFLFGFQISKKINRPENLSQELSQCLKDLSISNKNLNIYKTQIEKKIDLEKQEKIKKDLNKNNIINEALEDEEIKEEELAIMVDLDAVNKKIEQDIQRKKEKKKLTRLRSKPGNREGDFERVETIKESDEKDMEISLNSEKVNSGAQGVEASSLNLKTLSSGMKGKYTVQVGAFRSEYDAQQLTFSLYQDGFKDSYYRAIKIKGKGIWYRVGIGFFSRRSSAEVFANMLLNKAKIKSYIIRKL